MPTNPQAQDVVINVNANPFLAAIYINSWYLAQHLHVAQGLELTDEIKTELLKQVLEKTSIVEKALQGLTEKQKG